MKENTLLSFDAKTFLPLPHKTRSPAIVRVGRRTAYIRRPASDYRLWTERFPRSDYSSFHTCSVNAAIKRYNQRP